MALFLYALPDSEKIIGFSLPAKAEISSRVAGGYFIREGSFKERSKSFAFRSADFAIPFHVQASTFFPCHITPELSCVAHLPARTQPVVPSYCPMTVLERAEMQVCHVSYSALLGVFDPFFFFLSGTKNSCLFPQYSNRAKAT
jgi:hypothetical protein